MIGKVFAASHTNRYHPRTMKASKRSVVVLLISASLSASAFAQTPASVKEVDAVYPAAHALYLDLHQHPELSSHETQTASKLAGKLRDLGYEVTEHVGGTGIVAILKNGDGPTVMLRTELDALPVEENTGLACTWRRSSPPQQSWRTRKIPGTVR
jgi:hippurate hydrolase